MSPTVPYQYAAWPEICQTPGVVDVTKVAVTDWAAFILTRHDPGPEQAPLQAIKIESGSGAALRVTSVLYSYSSEQSAPQLIPAGLLVIIPLPGPLLLTDKV